MLLYRPVGLEELRLIAEAGYLAFPPRLPDQPIFYPVISLGYARQIAADWNVKAPAYVGFVTQFEVEDEFAARYPVQRVGGRHHMELWVPADELEELNRHILQPVRVLEAYCGPGFTDEIAPETNLPMSWNQSVPFSPKSVDELVSTYSESDSRRIRFAWNGQHGDSFGDANDVFRAAVLDHVMRNLELVPVVLIRDLFAALTAYSREAWAIDLRVRDLAHALVRRGTPEFIVDYLRGATQSFDARLGSSVADLQPNILKSCVAEIQRRALVATDEAELQLLRMGEEMFARWLEASD